MDYWSYCWCVSVMNYVPRGELFSAWKHYGHFSEALVQIYIAELAMVIGKSIIVFFRHLQYLWVCIHVIYRCICVSPDIGRQIETDELLYVFLSGLIPCPFPKPSPQTFYWKMVWHNGLMQIYWFSFLQKFKHNLFSTMG